MDISQSKCTSARPLSKETLAQDQTKVSVPIVHSVHSARYHTTCYMLHVPLKPLAVGTPHHPEPFPNRLPAAQYHSHLQGRHVH